MSGSTLTVRVDKNSTLQGVTLFDLQGKFILQKESTKAVSDLTINTANLNPGVYIIQINTDSQQLNKRVIIE